ncbi:MAG: hypothetical protein AAF547_13465, partial [Actinomycetota bacterium]
MTAATSSSRPSVTDPTRRRIGRAIAGGSTLIAAVAVVSIAAMGRWAFLLDNGVLLFAVTAIGLGILAWVMLAPQPSNTAVWVFVLAAGFSALAVTGQAFQAYAARDLPEVIDIVRWAPADLSTWLAVAIGPAWWAWAPGLFLPVTLGVLLFPDGRLPGPRWRWLALASVVSIGLIVGAFLWEMRPTSTVLYDFGEAEDDDTLVSQLFGIGFVGGVVCGVASVVALVARHRRSAPEVKRQLRMVVVGYLGFLVGGLGSVLVDIVSGGGLNNADTPVLDRLLLLSGQLALLAGFAVAILKYRLYDLDLVISKAFTALALAGFITAGYVGLVVGIGRLLGGDADTAVSLAAIAVVAVAFHPVRRIVQRAANRLVYGDRASPYEVLARFGRRAAESDEALIGRVPELVVGGTGATSATLWRRTGGVLEVVATWPRTDDSDRTVAHASAETPDPDADRSWPIEHDGELLGGLTLVEARGERLSSSDERVVTSLVLALGLAMRNARLTDQLRASIVELEASRARVLAAADEARRSLEADLERGPLQRLAAVEAGHRACPGPVDCAGAHRSTPGRGRPKLDPPSRRPTPAAPGQHLRRRDRDRSSARHRTGSRRAALRAALRPRGTRARPGAARATRETRRGLPHRT